MSPTVVSVLLHLGLVGLVYVVLALPPLIPQGEEYVVIEFPKVPPEPIRTPEKPLQPKAPPKPVPPKQRAVFGL